MSSHANQPRGHLPPERSETPEDPSTAARRSRSHVAVGGQDFAAIRDTFAEHWAPLVAYLTALTGSRDTAEDVAQQTFWRLWERRASWRIQGSLRAFLFKVARNLAVSEYRRRVLVHERSVESASRDVVGVITPLEHLEQDELRRTLEQAISGLPRRRREVFVLRCVHGLSQKQVAEVMGIAPQTVANQLGSAIAELREVLGPLLT